MSAARIVKPDGFLSKKSCDEKSCDERARDTATLLTLIAQGDIEAFGELYRIQLAPIRAVIFRLVRDIHQTDEVAQEVMLQIWQLAGQFDPARGTAVTWINQIARTRAIDRVRHCQAARLRDHQHAAQSYVSAFDAVSEAALLHVDVAHLHRGLLSVTPLQREALLLAFFSDSTYTQIARDLGVPLSTLKTRVRDGLRRLRKIIERFDPAESIAA